jgi:hypothetical protein
MHRHKQRNEISAAAAGVPAEEPVPPLVTLPGSYNAQ